MFETTGVINRGLLEKIKRYLFPKKLRILYFIGFCISIVAFIVAMITNDFFTSIASLFGVFIFPFSYVKSTKITIERLIERFKENLNKEETSYKTLFNEEGVVIHNLDDQSEVNIKYESFDSIAEVEDAFAIFSKTRQLFMVNKKCLEDKEINEFRNFIKEKCKNLNEIKFIK